MLSGQHWGAFIQSSFAMPTCCAGCSRMKWLLSIANVRSGVMWGYLESDHVATVPYISPFEEFLFNSILFMFIFFFFVLYWPSVITPHLKVKKCISWECRQSMLLSSVLLKAIFLFHKVAALLLLRDFFTGKSTTKR